MNIKSLSAQFAVSPQIAVSDMEALKGAGFRSIICNRPDGEGEDQPPFAAIAAAASQAGLKAAYLPITSGSITQDDCDRFAALLRDLPGPVLGFCRSGMRSATMWSLHEAPTRPLTDIMAATQAAGYDMTDLARRLVNAGS